MTDQAANPASPLGLPPASLELPPAQPASASPWAAAHASAASVAWASPATPIVGPPPSMGGTDGRSYYVPGPASGPAGYLPVADATPLAPPPSSLGSPGHVAAGGSGGSAGKVFALLLAAAVVLAGFAFGPKAIDALNGDQCSDVAGMTYDQQVAAARKVLDNSSLDYSDEPAEYWVDDLVSYCDANPDDDLDDISPYGI